MNILTRTSRRYITSNYSKMASSEPTSAQRRLIDDILCLYQCNPKEQSYIHYTDDAVFHDPVSIAKGRKSIQSQFNGMPKIFAQSTTERSSHVYLIIVTMTESIRLLCTPRIDSRDTQAGPYAALRLQEAFRRQDGYREDR